MSFQDIDVDDSNDFCSRCFVIDNLVSTKCHKVCLKCLNDVVDKSIDTCSYCGKKYDKKQLRVLLKKNIEEEAENKFNEYIKKHDIDLDGKLFCYSSGDNWWLYDSETNKIIVDAQDAGKKSVTVAVKVGNSKINYVIDFVKMIQYNENQPGKKRKIKVIDGVEDQDGFDCEDVIGIAGFLFDF